MTIQHADLTIEISYADLVADPQGKAALDALEAIAAAKAGRIVGLAPGDAEIVGMGKVTCQVTLSAGGAVE